MWPKDLSALRFVTQLCFIFFELPGFCESGKSKRSLIFLSWFPDDEFNGDEQTLLVLKDQISRYHSREERERLDELGRRQSEERLLSKTGMSELTDLYDRYNNGEPLDSIVTSLRHPGMLWTFLITASFSYLIALYFLSPKASTLPSTAISQYVFVSLTADLHLPAPDRQYSHKNLNSRSVIWHLTVLDVQLIYSHYRQTLVWMVQGS